MNPPVVMMSAFTSGDDGGNPAGVVLDAASLGEREFRSIAAAVGVSETAFITERSEVDGSTNLSVRYFSPAGEIPFCGHATLATAAALVGDGARGPFRFKTRAGVVAVSAEQDAQGFSAGFRSVAGRLMPVPQEAVQTAVRLLGWKLEELDLAHPPLVAFGGSWHLILSTSSRARLRQLQYDPAPMRRLMDTHGWATVHLTCAESPTRYHVRGVFPAGDLVEDPATGSAAAAFAHYLYTLGHVNARRRLTFLQGEDMGRPCQLTAEGAEEGGILVGGRVRRLSEGNGSARVGGASGLIRRMTDAEPLLWWRSL